MPFDENPYAPPAAAVELPLSAPATRSVVPRVFGILSIVFSGLWVLTLVPVAVYHAATPPQGAAIRPASPASRPVAAETAAGESDQMAGPAICLGLGFMLGSLSLLVIGIGQVRYRRWSARGTVVWSLLALGVLAGSWTWATVVVKGGRPLMQLLPITLMLLPYPILLLVFFLRRGVVASMWR